MKTLNVKRITTKELTEKWGFVPPWKSQDVFVRCDAKGNVNWEKAPVYFESELKDRLVVEIGGPEKIKLSQFAGQLKEHFDACAFLSSEEDAILKSIREEKSDLELAQSTVDCYNLEPELTEDEEALHSAAVKILEEK